MPLLSEIGIKRDMWQQRQSGLFAPTRRNFPTEGLQLFIPFWDGQQVGYALSYDGNDYLSNATANWRSGDTAGTLERMFRSSSTANNQTLFASADTGTDTSFLWIYVAQTTGLVTISTQDAAGTVNTVSGSTNICDGKDHHIVVTTNGSAWVIFIDGVTESLSVVAGSNTGDWLGDVTLRDNLTIGAITRTSTASYTIGVNGYTRIYSRVMAVAEARTNYQRGRFASASDATGLVFNLPLTEGAGNPVDTVGALTMTVTGATWIESLMDKSPNALPMSAFGIPTWGNTGRTFDGDNDNVIFPDLSISGAISIIMDVKPTAVAGDTQALLRQYRADPADLNSIRIKSTDNKIRVYSTEPSEHYEDSDVAVTNGVWSQLAYVGSGANFWFYINGADVGGTQVGGTHAVNWNLGTVYQIGGFGTACYKGIIGNMLIYNRALASVEIARIY